MFLAVIAMSSVAMPGMAVAQDTPSGATSADQAADQAKTAAPGPERVDLPALTRLAVHSPRAQMARHATRAAEARVGEVTGAIYPKVEITAQALPTPDITCQNDDCTRTDPDNGLTGFSGIAGSARVEAIQPLYGFGRSGPILRAARAAAQATGFLENAVVGDLAVEAARAYHGLKLARELAWMLEGGLEDIDKALTTIDELIEEGDGEATLQDRLRVATLQAEIQARLSEAKQAEAIALAGVRALSGKDSVDIDETPLEPVELTLTPVDDYVARAGTERPEIQAARAGAEAAHAKRQFESAGHLPVLYLFADYQLSGASGIDDPPSLFAQDPYNRHVFQAGVTLRWKLDVITQRARVAQARAQAHQADALVALARDATGFDVRKTHAEATQARARMEAAQKGEKTARSWVASVLQATAIGTIESKEVADALIAHFTLRARYMTSVYEWNVATVRLRRAVGSLGAGPEASAN